MIITAHAYARAGLVGNPSDGYFGKTISFIIRNFSATVRLWESPHFEILPDARRPRPLRQRRRVPPRPEAPRLLRRPAPHQGGHQKVPRLLPPEGTRAADDRSFTVSFETDIPRLVGLSGSSAIITAMMRALMEFYEVDIPKHFLPTLILSVEKEELGIAAGLQDRVIQMYEGIVYMDFDRKLMESRGYGIYEELQPREDAAALRRVRPGARGGERRPAPQPAPALRPRRPDRRRGDAAYRDLTDRGRVALMSGDWDALGRIMNENFDLRKTFMNIAPENQRMVEVARSTGASAKFSGSGGAICGLYKDGRQYQQLVDALAALRCSVLRPIIYEA